MRLRRVGLVAMGTYLAFAALGHARLARAAKAPRALAPRPFSVSVLVPTLDEAAYVSDTLESLSRQRLAFAGAERMEILLVDSASEDATAEIARPYVDRIVPAPRGKLNALAAGIAAARGEVIVEADADGVYPPYFVHEITSPLEDPLVSGVIAPVAYADSPASFVVNAAMDPLNHLLGKFPGGSRAYRKSAYLGAGGFDVSIDQSDLSALWREEEFRFPARLRRTGRLVVHPPAICFKSARRFDPVFVRDERARRFRAEIKRGKRFGLRS